MLFLADRIFIDVLAVVAGCHYFPLNSLGALFSNWGYTHAGMDYRKSSLGYVRNCLYNWHALVDQRCL